jgi:hypothetical protein
VTDLEARMKSRFEELEKLEGAFDVEVDITDMPDIKLDEAPVTTSVTEGDRDTE